MDLDLLRRGHKYTNFSVPVKGWQWQWTLSYASLSICLSVELEGPDLRLSGFLNFHVEIIISFNYVYEAMNLFKTLG